LVNEGDAHRSASFFLERTKLFALCRHHVRAQNTGKSYPKAITQSNVEMGFVIGCRQLLFTANQFYQLFHIPQRYCFSNTLLFISRS